MEDGPTAVATKLWAPWERAANSIESDSRMNSRTESERPASVMPNPVAKRLADSPPHAQCAGHPEIQWPREKWNQSAVLCGAGWRELTVEVYLGVDTCPACAALFNPGCQAPSYYYFAGGEALQRLGNASARSRREVRSSTGLSTVVAVASCQIAHLFRGRTA